MSRRRNQSKRGNLELTVYDPATGEIRAHLAVPSVDEATHMLEQGFALAEGHFEAQDYFINPDTGRANKHKSDATRPKVPIARRWAEVRNRRNRLLDANRWTVMPDSPVTAANQTEWLGYLKRLQAITVGVGDPADVVWPEQPAIVLNEEE
jgi:hypothetical protein